MIPIVTAFITFVCAFGGALAGIFIRSVLPPEHLSSESKDIVRLGMGLIATMTALLLGLVTASAKGSFDVVDKAVKNSAANILVFDRLLARYGPETKPIRALLRRGVVARLDATWPEESSRHAGPEASEARPQVEGIEDQVLRLSPKTDTQRWLQARALDASHEVTMARWLIFSGAANSVPLPFLAVVIFWLTAIFGSFGLYAPRNATVIAVLFLCAVSVAASVFLILEMDSPFDGMMKISSAPLRYTLAHMGP